MNLRSLMAYVELSHTLSFRKAAERLGMSQPSLTVRIRRFEDELRFQLFDRSSTGVALTEKGKAFLVEAEAVLARTMSARAAADRIGSGRIDRLRVGMTPMSVFSVGPRIIQSFRAAYPDTQVEVIEGYAKDVVGALERGELEIAFAHAAGAGEQLEGHRLAQEAYVAVMPASHPAAQESSVSLHQFAQDPFVAVRRDIGPITYDRLMRSCVEAGFLPRIVQEAGSFISLVGLIATGVGVGIVVRSAMLLQFPTIAYRPIRNFDLALPYYVYHRKGPVVGPLDGFLTISREVAREVLEPDRGQH